MSREEVSNLSSLIWSIAEILRGDYKQSDYGKVILPFVVLRRLDCILEPTKEAVLQAADELPDNVDVQTRDLILTGAAGDNIRVYNTSRFTFKTLHGQDPRQLHDNLVNYVSGFSATARDIFLDKFLFVDQLKRLNDSSLLWQVFDRFCQVDLHPLGDHDVVAGDLLVAGLGDGTNPVGRACVAPVGIEPAMVKADCLRVRFDQNYIRHEFLAKYLSSTIGTHEVALRAKGVTRIRANLGIVSAIPVPYVPLSEQDRVIALINAEQDRVRPIEEQIYRSITSLRQLRVALITAAVTGQLDE